MFCRCIFACRIYQRQNSNKIFNRLIIKSAHYCSLLIKFKFCDVSVEKTQYIFQNLVSKTLKKTTIMIVENTICILAANSSKICQSSYIYLLIISAWRFSTKSTLISKIQTDNNHKLTVRVTAFPSHASYVLHAQQAV